MEQESAKVVNVNDRNMLNVTMDTTPLTLRETHSNATITEGEWVTKLAVLMGDGEWETDLLRQLVWILSGLVS